MGKNNKAGSLKIPEKAMAILSNIKVKKMQPTLSFLNSEALRTLMTNTMFTCVLRRKVAAINNTLKDVKKAAGITKKPYHAHTEAFLWQYFRG